MKSSKALIFISIVLGISMLAGCATPLIPSTGDQPNCCAASQDVLTVRDNVINFVQQTYDQPDLDEDLDWSEYHLPNINSSSVIMYEYAAQGWVITIVYPVLQFGGKKFIVTVNNALDGFEWNGEVDGQGNILTP